MLEEENFSKLLHGFVKIYTWISLGCNIHFPNMDLSKLLHGFVKVVLCISLPFPNKTKLKFDQISKPVEASASNRRCLMNQSTQCLGSVVP